MLFEKIMGIEEQSVQIPLYALTGLLDETYRGQITYAQMRVKLADFGYTDADDKADLDWLKDKLLALPDVPLGIGRVKHFLRLAEIGVSGYATKSEFVALVNEL